MNKIEDVVLIKINQSYKEDMSSEELYNVTSVSWVANFKKTETRDLKYYCAVYRNKIVGVFDFLGYEEEFPRRKPPRYILHGHETSEEVRNKLIGLDLGDFHSGNNPIRYTNLESLLYLMENGVFPLKSDVFPSGNDVKPVEPFINTIDLVNNIHSYITSQGFTYSPSNIKNLYLSLRSKPFVIISGISGTGKTKIVQLFAESVGATEVNGQYKLIPVRPDWSDGSELLGYIDLKSDFQKGPLTEMVEHAMDNPDLPHFVLLDEMNLARVEYYFSDVLSVMESRKRDGDRIVTSNLLDEKYIGRPVRLPENLYIMGTVNMDETTHPFSKKVLDRANTIEFNEIYLEDFDFLQEREVPEVQRASNDHLIANYISLKDVYKEYGQLVQKISNDLSSINKILVTMNLHVGYRVRDEICFYMIHNANTELLDEHEAFDFCMMQKILPRITGSDGRIEILLNDLFEWLTGMPYDVDSNSTSIKYPRSAKKITEMLRRYHLDGFTSFWIS